MRAVESVLTPKGFTHSLKGQRLLLLHHRVTAKQYSYGAFSGTDLGGAPLVEWCSLLPCAKLNERSLPGRLDVGYLIDKLRLQAGNK